MPYLILVLLFVFPPLFFHLAFRPFFEPVWRVLVGGLSWSFFYGVVGAMMVNAPAASVPLRMLVGFIAMGVGLAICDVVERLWSKRVSRRHY